jgi:hypothetical protein
MLKYVSYLVLFLSFQFGFSQEIHCGYDFTSYIVVEPREDGKSQVIDRLKVTLVDFLGFDLVNTDNKYSWTKTNEVLQFYKNYKIDSKGKRTQTEDPNGKWYFYFANDAYLISVNNEFQAEHFRIKIEDPDGVYKTTFIPLNSFNMYVLCTGEARVAQFGRRSNQPIKVVVEKN